MFIVDCSKCPLNGVCKYANIKFQDVNSCPLAHAVYVNHHDWLLIPLKGKEE